ncbi:MAG TPA: phage tail sheath subtilisin-like domain-containing protein [Candidatus Angelobacter sp.]
MPEFLVPGVYVQEISTGLSPIEGVSTSIAGFVGIGQITNPPALITSLADFERSVANPSSNFFQAVRGFFSNGGKRGYVAGISGKNTVQSALDALAGTKISLLASPDQDQFPGAAAAMTSYCEQRKDCFCILQSPQATLSQPPAELVHSDFAAYYGPWIKIEAFTGNATVDIPPCGHIAGTYAQTDSHRGVQAMPANTPLTLALDVSQVIDPVTAERFTSQGVNVIVKIPGRGTLSQTAVTTSTHAEWKYVNVRRLLIFLEQSLIQGLQWTVFEPNTPTLWARARLVVEEFLRMLWTKKIFAGNTTKEAFFVRCGTNTMTQNDIDSGRMVIIVGVAPLKPAEFVVIEITSVSGKSPTKP